jgi:DNA-binding GntR family transcriptional regulator
MSTPEITPTNVLRVQEELREAILAGTLEPGTRLRAEAVAERLNTSRTPVREALVLLAREGLVEIEPRRGASVRAFDAADLADLYDVRALIEPHAARRAATRVAPAQLARMRELCRLSEQRGADDEQSVSDPLTLNDEFHGIILRAADSPRLEAAMSALVGIPRVFRATFWRDDHQRVQSQFCHDQLVSAFVAGNADLAETVMRLHIQGACVFLMDVMAGKSLTRTQHRQRRRRRSATAEVTT